MSLELLNTCASLATVAIVLATAIAAIIQLRHLRISNQITALLSIGERFDAPAYVDAYLLVDRKLESALEDPSFRAYEIAHARNQPLPDTDPALLEVRRAAVLIGNMYDELGLLVQNGLIDRNLFVYQYAPHIVEQWNRMEHYIAFTRDAQGNNGVWEMYECLVVVTFDFLRSNPATYPKGLRRLPLHNPWPIASPASGPTSPESLKELR
jgi:hypothetical protein